MSIFRVGRHGRCCSSAFRALSRQYASAEAVTLSSPYSSAAETHRDVPRRRTRKKALPAKPRDTSPTVLDNSEVHNFLANIAATKETITLEDVERHKPARHVDPARDYDKYLEEYNTLQEVLANSFNIKQLRQFLRLYGFKGVYPTKPAYAAQIMEQAWDYPSLADIIRQRKDATEEVSQSFPLTRPQSFLLLGKDGLNLHDLTRQYSLRMSFSSNPFGLKASGLRGNIHAFGEYLAEFKQGIFDEVYDIPTQKNLEPDALQRVSRLTGAFTESFGEGQIKVHYRADLPKTLLAAKRHAARASCETSFIPGDLLAHVPNPTVSGPDSLAKFNYSLFPFLPSRALSTTSTINAGAFRLRRVGEWFGFGPDQSVPKSGSLQSFSGALISLSDKHSRLRGILDELKAFDGQKKVVASLGHVLLTTPGSSQSSLTPPLKGSFSITDVFSWLSKHTLNRLFVPTIPPAIYDQSTPRHRLLHRLEYMAFDPTPAKTIRLEMVLRPGTTNGIDIDEPLVHECRAGTESTFDLMLPNRPVDIQMIVSDMAPLPQDTWPSELTSYVSSLEGYVHDTTGTLSQPESAPLTIEHEGDMYILRSSASVRQQLPDADAGFITESALDLESNEKSSLCQIICANPSSDENWAQFADTCEQLSQVETAPSGILGP